MYKSILTLRETEKGIKLVKDTFQKKLAKALHLERASAPPFLETGTGMQDDLAGTQTPVGFKVKHTDKIIEIPHSLAKWKRHALGRYGYQPGEGIWTDMNAVRKDEDISDIHSIYVDQWDWELVVTKEQRTVEFLKEIVKKIYQAILDTEAEIEKEFPKLITRLPREITFVHSEELEEKYPDLTSKQREDKAAEEYGAIFLIGIGHPLASGQPHDLRAADYDDWITETSEKRRGLNGDIIIWDPIRQKSLELSSMGIRVDAKSLLAQLEHMGLSERKELEFHKGILENKTPLSIGGGIGQSRICMLLLKKAHIGEVQASVWPEGMVKECEAKGILLL